MTILRFLRGYLLASLAAAIAFTLVFAALEREGNVGNILAGLTVFSFYALAYTAVLAPAGLLLLRRLRRDGVRHYALTGAALGWLSSIVLFRSVWGLVLPLALAFTCAGLAAGLAFRLGFGASRKPESTA